MVRVKKQDSNTVSSHHITKAEETKPKATLLDTAVSLTPKDSLRQERKTPHILVHYPEVEKQVNNLIVKDYFQPQDSVFKETESSEYVRTQYTKANRYSVIALVGFFLTPFWLFPLLIGIFYAIRAVRIYRKYRNPGIKERYGMAMFVLVAGGLLIAAGIATLGIFLSGY